jgi:hypothetical protein
MVKNQAKRLFPILNQLSIFQAKRITTKTRVIREFVAKREGNRQKSWKTTQAERPNIKKLFVVKTLRTLCETLSEAP